MRLYFAQHQIGPSSSVNFKQFDEFIRVIKLDKRFYQNSHLLCAGDVKTSWGALNVKFIIFSISIPIFSADHLKITAIILIDH